MFPASPTLCSPYPLLSSPLLARKPGCRRNSIVPSPLSPCGLHVVMSTSSTCKYEYSWEIPKRKLVLDSYLSMRVPIWDASTQVLVLLVSVQVLVLDEYSLRDEYYEYSSEYLSLCEYSLSIRTMYLAYVIRSSFHMHAVGYCKEHWLALL